MLPWWSGHLLLTGCWRQWLYSSDGFWEAALQIRGRLCVGTALCAVGASRQFCSSIVKELHLVLQLCFFNLSYSKYKRSMWLLHSEFLLPGLSVSHSKCQSACSGFKIYLFLRGDTRHFSADAYIYIQRAVSKFLLWHMYTLFIKILVCKYWLW